VIRHRFLVTGIAALSALALGCVAGPLLLPGLPAHDPVHGALLPPLTRVVVVTLDSGSVLVGQRIERAAGLYSLSHGEDRTELGEARVRSVGHHLFVLGSDRYGRDVLLLLLRGGRLSLIIAALGAVISLLVGSTVGIVAATGGRFIDTILMRLVDGLLAFPVLFLMIMVAAVFRPGALLLAVVLGLTSWMSLARLVRGQVLTLRQRTFVVAARAAGSPWHRIWKLHYAPHLVAPVSQDTALRLGDLVIAEATLSFLGMGVPPTSPTWGVLVAEGHQVLPGGWWLTVFPGLAIALLVIGFALIGDGLQERGGAAT
jgi:peptide/nickel transport system permease protein